MTARHAGIDSPIGELTLTADGATLTGVYFVDHRHPPRVEQLGERVQPRDDATLDAVRSQLDQYFGGDLRAFDLDLAPVGTPFQTRVWELLRGIDFGCTTTYAALAQRIGGAGMARAVGAAVGRNPISIIVPCHRVVGSAGGLTGFAGGLHRKRHLLDLEGAPLEPMLF